MPSTSIIASSVLALAGFAAAIPAFGNGTTFGNGTAAGAAAASGVAMSSGSRMNATATSSSASSKATGDALFCPTLNGQIYLDNKKISYLIECNTNRYGTTFEIDVSITNAKVRRQAAGPTSLADCLAVCDDTTTCVGTAFNTAADTCTYYSDIEGSYAEDGVDFAMKVDTGATTTTVAAGDLTTSTVFSTSLSTILSCAPTVTNCPLRGSVVTDVVVDYTTVCPATAGAVNTIAAKPVACTDCPYSATTATVYSTTVSTILSCSSTVTNCPLTATTTVVPVSTVVINSPIPTGTGVSTAAAQTVTVKNNGAASGTASGPTATSSGLVSFTGAADNLKAGVGMAAMLFGAAIMI